MAAGDKLWFELGVRDEISSVLEKLMRNSQTLANLLSDDSDELRIIYKNIADIANVYDKIYVAQKRISELKGTNLSADEKKGLRDMSKELEKVRKEFESIFKDPDRLFEKGEAAFDKTRTNLELMVKKTLSYVDGIEAKEKAEAINAANEERRIDGLKAKYYELQRQRQDLSNAIANAAPGTDTSGAVSLLNGITARMGAVRNAQRNGSGMPASLVGADADEFFRKVKAEISGLNATTRDYNTTLETNTRLQKQLEKAYLDTQSQQKIAYIKKEQAEYTALGQKMNDIALLMRNLSQDRANVMAGGQAVYTQEKVMETLNDINRRYNETLARGREQEKPSAKSKADYANAARRAAQATQNLSNANRGLMSTFKEVEQAGKRTNKIIDQMAMSFGTMFSYYGIKRLLQNIITIGGQFEFQHMALQNILGDVQEANVLFTQLQGLAVESPKTFMELTSYAKQLSAYQIPANELYDTTKRLADMSTGLGVDMSRLILAYGQVRSAAVLRGQELRQFTEAGIPLVQKLADKFTEMNGKLTTTADVFKLISARKVPFEMVKEILWDMTDQGGQFYNMQSELADTLYGKWQKLQDTWQIMLGHLADGNSLTGAFMRTSVEGLVALTRSLDTLMPLLAMFAFGKYTTAIGRRLPAAWEKVTSNSDELALSNMRLTKEREANRLMKERYKTGRMLTQQEWELVRTKDRITLNDKLQLVYENRLSEQSLVRTLNQERQDYELERQRLILNGMTQQEAKLALIERERNILASYRLLLMRGYTKEQIRQMQIGNMQMLQGPQNFFGKMKNGILGFMGGWVGVAMTALGGVFSIISSIKQKNEELEQKGESMMKHAQENANSIQKVLNASEGEASTAKKIEALEEALLQTGRTGEAIVAKSRENMDDIAKRWDVLKQEAEEYDEVLKSMGNPKGKALFTEALEKSGIEKRLKEYDEAVSDVFKQYSSLERFSEIYKEFIAEMIKGNDKLTEKLKGKNLFEQIDIVGAENIVKKIDEKIKTLKENTTERIYLLQAAGSLRTHVDYLDDVTIAWAKITDKSIPEMENALRAAARNIGIEKFDQLTTEQKRSLEALTREFVNSFEEGSVEAKNKLAQELAGQVFHIKIVGDLTIDKTKMSGFANYVWAKFGGNSKLNRKLGDKGNVKIGNSVFTKAQVASVFGDVDDFAKSYNSEWNSLNTTVKRLNKSGATELANETQNEADNIKSVLDALGLFEPKGNKGKGSQKDAILEGIKNRVDLYKKFYQELQNYSKLYGEQGSLAKLRKDGEFEKVFEWKDKGAIKDLTDYESSVRSLTSVLVGSTEQRQKFLDSTNADIQAKARAKETEAMKEYVSELQKMLSVMSENYTTYKKWVYLTGDAELAARVAGVTQNTSYADYLTDAMRKELGKTNLALTPEDVFGLKESEVKKLGKDNALFALWDEWRKNQQKLKKEQWDLYEEAIKNSKNYDDKIADINRKLKEQIEAIEKLASTDEERARLTGNATKNAEKEISKIKWEKFKDENNWGDIFGDIENVSVKKLKKLIKAMQNLRDTTHLNVVETKAWHEGMNKAIDTMTKSDSVESIKTAIKNYKDAIKAYNALEMKGEGVRRGYYKDEFPDEKAYKDALNAAAEGIDKARKAIVKAISAFAKDIQKLGSVFDSLSKTVEGDFGDILSGIGAVFGGLGKSIEAAASINTEAKGISGLINKVGAVVTVFDAMVEMNKKLDSLLPDNYSRYEKYAEKAREINKLREAVDNYAVAVAEANAEEKEWFAGNSLSSLRSNGEKAKKTLEAYFGELYENQEAYQDKGSGLSKWAVPIAAGIATVIAGIVTAGAGAAASFAILGSAITGGLATGAAATAIGGLIAAGIGTAVGQVAQSVVSGITYKDGQIDARSNMRIQTQHSSFWRGEKTKNLEEWVRDELHAELFDSEGLVNLEAAQEVLDKYGNKLVGDTEETLKRLVELRKEYDEFIKQIEDYVGEIGTSLADDMTNAIWDWLSDGKNALDQFKEYASDTWKSIAQDIVKTFVKIAVLDKYSDAFKELFKGWSLGKYDDNELIASVSMLAGAITKDFESALPLAEQIATTLNDAFKAQGFDITNNDSSKSSTSSSLKSVSEQTADLIAGYVNAIRADCSVNRVTLTQILASVQTQAEMPIIARAQLTQLQTIAGNTGKNAETVGYIYELLHRIAPDGTAWKVK